MKRLIGKWDASIIGNRTYYIYKDDNEYSIYYPNEIIDIPFNDVIENLAVIMNSPLTTTDVTYFIMIDEDLSSNDTVWSCECNVIATEAITAIVMGYGSSPEYALSDCVKTMNYIQQTYNPDGLRI